MPDGTNIGALAHAQTFLEALVRIAGNTRGKFVVCAYGDPGIKEVRHVETGPEVANGLMAAVAELSAIEGANVYLAPVIYRHDLPAGQRGTKDDILTMLAIVPDFDRHEGPAIDWRARVAPIEPSLVVETSPGNFQCWIFLDRPYAPKEAAPIAAALVQHTGCDPFTADVNHIWRVPGCLNYPNARKISEGRSPAPFPATIVEDQTWQDYSPAQLRGLLPEPSSPVSEPGDNGSRSWRDRTPISPAKLERTLAYVSPDISRPEWWPIAKMLWHGQVNLAREMPEEWWHNLLDEWSSGLLWRKRTGDWNFAPADYHGREANEAELGGHARDEGAAGYGTIYTRANAAGFNEPPHDNDTPAAQAFKDSISTLEVAGAPKGYSRHRLYTLEEAALLKPPEFYDDDGLLPHYAGQPALTMAYAPPHNLKTFLLLRFAVYLARKGKRVLLCASEGFSGVGTFRISAVCELYGTTRKDLAPFIKLDPFCPLLAEPEDIKDFVAVAQDFRPDVTMFDTYSNASRAAGSSNDEQEVKQAIHVIRYDIMSRLHSDCLLTHHTNRQNTIAGSYQFEALVDGLLKLTYAREQKVLTVHVDKMRDGKDDFDVLFPVEYVPVHGSRDPVPVVGMGSLSATEAKAVAASRRTTKRVQEATMVMVQDVARALLALEAVDGVGAPQPRGMVAKEMVCLRHPSLGATGEADPEYLTALAEVTEWLHDNSKGKSRTAQEGRILAKLGIARRVGRQGKDGQACLDTAYALPANWPELIPGVGEGTDGHE